MTERPKTIGGSDAVKIWNGEWQDLWMEKTGRKEPNDLSGVFRVQLGVYTEPFHLDWLQGQMGYEVTDHQLVVTHPECEWGHATLDARVIDGPGKFPLEVKHTHGRQDVYECASYYGPQLQHQMAMTETDRLLFSAICGNSDPNPIWIERDNDFIDELMQLEYAFWQLVKEDKPPAGDHHPQERTMACLKEVNMTKESIANEWGSFAATIVDLHPKEATIKKDLKKAKDEIKKLMPEDARVAYGNGVRISRSKTGTLTLTVKD